MQNIITVKEAYDQIGADCIAAAMAGITIEEWEAMDESARLHVAKEYAEWLNSLPEC